MRDRRAMRRVHHHDIAAQPRRDAPAIRRSRGLRIPEDIALMGTEDDTSLAPMVHRPLTSVPYHARRIGSGDHFFDATAHVERLLEPEVLGDQRAAAFGDAQHPCRRRGFQGALDEEGVAVAHLHTLQPDSRADHQPALALGASGDCADVGAKLALELQQQALGGFFANARDFHQAPRLLLADGTRQLGHAHAAEHAQRRARPHAGNFDQLAKDLTLAGRRKTVQNLGVFPHHKMGQQGHFFAQRRQVVERAHGHIHFIPHAMTIQ